VYSRGRIIGRSRTFTPPTRTAVAVVVYTPSAACCCSCGCCLNPQRGPDVGLHRVRVFLGAESFDRPAFFVHEKFSEIPFDGVEERAALGLFEILPQGIRIGSINFDLLEKIEGDAVGSGGVILNFGVRSRLLPAKLVAGKRENLEPGFSILAIQSL